VCDISTYPVSTDVPMNLDTIKVLLPTDTQKKILQNNVKIYIKTIPTRFCVITIIRERKFELAKVTFVKTVH
jgi:hypothetical protein